MRRIVPAILLVCLAIANFSYSQEFKRVLPEPLATVSNEQLTLDFFFTELQQGRVGLVRLTGNGFALDEAALSLFNRRIEFFKIEGEEDLFALVSTNLDQARRDYTGTVNALSADGATLEPLRFIIDVTNGDFIRQDVTLVEDDRIEDLLNEEIETNELSQIFSLAAASVEPPQWGDVGFVPPIAGQLTSPFGAVRVFNGTYNSRHTGWDFSAVIGAPMRASAAGHVVFAGFLPIRGNYVLIDHGQGVLSGYAHLSVIYVTQGQDLAAGQIIGQVGNTGRSSSAHAHVEIIVDGNWVDTADFLAMDLP